MAYSNVALLSGFETQSSAEWDTFVGSIDATDERTGVYCADLANTGVLGSPGGIFTGSSATCRLYFKATDFETTVQAIFLFRDSTPTELGRVSVQKNGSTFDVFVLVTNGTQQTVGTGYAFNVYHCLEVKYIQGSGSDATIEAKMNSGSAVASDDGNLTLAPDDFEVYGSNAVPNGENIYIDDVIAFDSGIYPGPGQIETLRAEGDSGDSGEDEWEGEDAGGDTYDNVSEDPLDETHWAIESLQNDPDHRQLWTLPTISSVGTINHVKIYIQAERGSGSGTEHRMRSKVSTPENSADLALTTVSLFYMWSPTTQPSSQSELDGYQAGVWRDDGGREFYCYEQWVMVDYTPGAPPSEVVKDVISGGIIPFAR